MNQLNNLHFLVADDHALFRDGIRLVLEQLDDAHVDEARNGQDIESRLLKEPLIDILLLDYNMPGVNTIENIKKICVLSPATAVIMMSGDESSQIIKGCLKAGASGFIPKSSSSAIMLSAIQMVLSGGQYIPQEMLHMPTKVRHADDIALTRRQQEILGLISDGLSNKLIAHQLKLSENTVKQHVSALFRKLKVNSRTQALHKLQEGL